LEAELVEAEQVLAVVVVEAKWSQDLLPQLLEITALLLVQVALPISAVVEMATAVQHLVKLQQVVEAEQDLLLLMVMLAQVVEAAVQ
jgi:hypothetical protein